MRNPFKVKMIPPKQCILWHRWVLVKDTGTIKYSECKDCGARFGIAKIPEYEPIDYGWVIGKKPELD